MNHRAPRFAFSNHSSPDAARSWARARASHAAATVVVAGSQPRTTRPGGIRVVRTVRRDATRRTTPLEQGWRR